MRTTKVKTQGHLLLVCEGCHAPAAQRLVRRSRWFTLGGRAVVRLGREHVLHCTLCGSAAPMDNRDAYRLLADRHALAPVAVDPDLAHDLLDPTDR